MSNNKEQFTYRITLLRHGESSGNSQNIFQGHAEYDLTEKGRAQSKAVATRWLDEGKTFMRIISSPQSRARQTAEIIAEILSLPLEFDSNWKEINNGVLAGLTLDEIGKRYPSPEIITPYEPIGESGESHWDLYLRAGRVVQELIRRPAGNYLVVSHGGFLNRVLYAMLGIVPQANFSGARFRFRNTSFAVVCYDPEQHIWLFDQLNDRAHWPEDTTTSN
jgi:2,3-bisphosphoglycerate-dependent phosphoglycerate mutase